MEVTREESIREMEENIREILEGLFGKKSGRPKRKRKQIAVVVRCGECYAKFVVTGSVAQEFETKGWAREVYCPVCGSGWLDKVGYAVIER